MSFNYHKTIDGLYLYCHITLQLMVCNVLIDLIQALITSCTCITDYHAHKPVAIRDRILENQP